MLVITMSDFLGNPALYVERARHVPVQIEDMGEKPVTLSARRPGIFAAIANLFKPKPRLLGIGKGKMKLEFVGDWDVTPEELFDDDKEAYFLPIEPRQE